MIHVSCYSGRVILNSRSKPLKIIHVVEIFAAIGVRFLHQADFDQVVDDFAEVAGDVHSPTVKHDARHQPKLLQRELPNRLAQLLARQVRIGRRVIRRRLGGRCPMPSSSCA